MTPRRFSPGHRQAGISLVELLISMTIGMVIALAATSAYLGASTAGGVAEAQGRMNEDGQMALSIVTQQLRMAGANPSQPNRTISAVQTSSRNMLNNYYAVRGCDVTFSNVTSATSAGALTCSHTSSSTGPDSISIGYEADSYNTSISTAGGTPTDALGAALTPTVRSVSSTLNVSSNVNVYEAENRYYVGTTSVIVTPSLYAKGNGSGSNATALVENIEDMQITYGVSVPTSPGTVAGYLSAYQVQTDSNLNTAVDPSGGAAGSNLARWDSVKTVRVCVIARSATQINTGTGTSASNYYNCAGVLTTAPDSRLRRAYTTTVVLRNQ